MRLNNNVLIAILSGILFFSITSLPLAQTQTEYFVSTDGSDEYGDGTENNPWETITHALDNADDGSEVLVKPGEYSGRIRLRGTFEQGVTVKSQLPYHARLRHSETVLTAYADGKGCEGITIEGFDIAHDGAGAGALVFHIDGGGDRSVRRITVRNNVLHDSYNNDILKINNSTVNITVEGNMFYNQSGSDEHIDINSVDSVFVHDNIFFNDFEGSGRSNGNNTSSFIVIKDSNENDDFYTGSRGVVVNRNIFLNWEGSSSSNFVLIGEDGKPYHEGFDILIENNLMLGNSGNVMRSSFGVKGGKDITFRNNTVSGDLPSLAFAMRLNNEGSNPPNENICFYNNIWSDPTGTMGADASGSGNDFSDTPEGETVTFILHNNCYWNGGKSIPDDPAETVNPGDDEEAYETDPILGAPLTITPPRWDPQQNRFADQSESIRDVFSFLVYSFGAPHFSSLVQGNADPDHIPADDILGENRAQRYDLGCKRYTGTDIRYSEKGVYSDKNDTGFHILFDRSSLLLKINTMKPIHSAHIILYTISGKQFLKKRIRSRENHLSISLKTMDMKIRPGLYIIEIVSDSFISRVSIHLMY